MIAQKKGKVKRKISGKTVTKKKIIKKKKKKIKKKSKVSSKKKKSNTSIKPADRPIVYLKAKKIKPHFTWVLQEKRRKEEERKKKRKNKINTSIKAVNTRIKRLKNNIRSAAAKKGWLTRKNKLKEAVIKYMELEKKRLETERKIKELLESQSDILYNLGLSIEAGEILIEDIPKETVSAMYMKRLWDAIERGDEFEEFERVADELDCDVHDVYEFTYGYGELPG